MVRRTSTTDHDTAPFADAPAKNAQEHLEAFEKEHLADAPRYRDKVEMGHGSAYEKLSDELKAQHGALEELVASEGTVERARDALAAAVAANLAIAKRAGLEVGAEPARSESTGL